MSNAILGAPGQCAIVCEIGNAHNGSFAQILQLLDAVKESGATAAKLQCYTVAELVALRGDGPAPEPWGAQGWRMTSLYQKAVTPHRWFPSLYRYAEAIDLPLFSSVFGLDSLTLLESVGNPVYKIAALDNHEGWLADACQATGKPLVISVRSVADCMGRNPTRLLYCPAGYPQADLALRNLRTFGDVYGGFSYHGTSIEPLVAAATLGAQMLEFHVQLDHTPSELEASVSLTMSQTAELVRRVRHVEAMLA